MIFTTISLNCFMFWWILSTICIQIFWRRVKTPDFQSKVCRHRSQQLCKLADIEWMDSEINPNLKFRMRIRLISSDYLKLYRIISIVICLDLVKQLNGTRFCVTPKFLHVWRLQDLYQLFQPWQKCLIDKVLYLMCDNLQIIIINFI